VTWLYRVLLPHGGARGLASGNPRRPLWWRTRRVVAVGSLLGIILGLVYYGTAPHRFRATTDVYFALESSATTSELSQGSAYTQTLVQSYADLLTEPALLAPVVKHLGLTTTAEKLGREVSVDASAGSLLLSFSVTAGSGDRAATIANAIAAQLSATVSRLSSTTIANVVQVGAVRAIDVAPATPPSAPFSPQPLVDAGVGLGLGIIVGLLFGALAEALDHRIDDRSAIRRLTDLPVIGTIPYAPRDSRRPTYESLQVMLGLVGTGRHTVVVTAASERAGTSTTAIGLATALASVGRRVLLVDGNARRPAIARRLGLESSPGVAEVAVAGARCPDVVQQVAGSTLDVLVAGDSAYESVRTKMTLATEAVEAFAVDYDSVVIDTGAVSTSDAAAVLGARADGVILVADVHATRRRDITDALRSLRLAGAVPVGVVLNGFRTRTDHKDQRRTRRPRGRKAL
jgi:succinoglycan biosynthesis transport protein ExoP